MTEAGLWFVFCLLSPLPQREETLHGLFSTPRRKIYPPKAGEYCTIVVLKKKKSINFLPSWLHFRMIQTWWVQAAVWQSLPSKDWNLKGNGSLSQQNQIFFPDISCSDFCFSCQLGESYLIRKLSYLGRCSTMLESCSLCIKWYSKVELLLSSVLRFTGALVNKLGVTDFFSKTLASSGSNNGRGGS